MRRRGDRVIITSGRYKGYRGIVEANVYQKTVDYPDEWANGYHVMLDTEKLVTVRWDQVEAAPGRVLQSPPILMTPSWSTRN
jgi:ribosomal protein L24